MILIYDTGVHTIFIYDLFAGPFCPGQSASKSSDKLISNRDRGGQLKHLEINGNSYQEIMNFVLLITNFRITKCNDEKKIIKF